VTGTPAAEKSSRSEPFFSSGTVKFISLQPLSHGKGKKREVIARNIFFQNRNGGG
jgi:hypothetical protein